MFTTEKKNHSEQVADEKVEQRAREVLTALDSLDSIVESSRTLHMMSNNSEPPWWKRQQERLKQQKSRKEFADEYGKKWHWHNAIEGFIAYITMRHVTSEYLSDGAAVAVGFAAYTMSAIAPFVVPFLVGYAASRAGSVMMLDKEWAYWVGWLTISLCALVTIFQPLMLIGGLVTLNAPMVFTSVSMLFGAFIGYVTRHTRDQ